MTQRIERFTTYAVLIVFTVLVLTPFATIILVALGPEGPAVTGLEWPDEINFDNFPRAWSAGGFGDLLQSSALVAVFVVPTVAIFSVLGGYALGSLRFPGSTVLFYVFVLGLVMPFEAAVIPLYYGMRSVGLIDTYAALILPQIGLSMAFGVFWMRAYFLSTPRALVEAARLDGAGTFTILWKVLLPGARPAVTTLSALVFLWSWNEFLLGLVLIQDPGKRTAPAGLGLFIGERTTDIAGLSAGALIVTAPVVIVYFFLQRHFVQGMLSGSVKG